MKNVFFKTVILTFVLVFGIIVLACEEDDSGGGDPDTWTGVTSLEQIKGTWKHSGSLIQTDEGVTRKIEQEIIMTFNASAKTMSRSDEIIMTFSGSGSKFNTDWDSWKTTLGPAGTHTGTDPENGSTYTYIVTIDESAHKITTSSPSRTHELTNEEIAQITSYVQISKNGTKINYMGTIFYKQ